MRRFRAVVEPLDGGVQVRVDIHSWDVKADRWVWTTLERWTTEPGDGANRATSRRGAGLTEARLEEAALQEHGWVPVKHEPRHDEGGVDVEPLDWQGLITTVASRRDELRREATALDSALPDIIGDAAEHKAVSVSRAASLVGLTRGRIYQLRTETVTSMQRAGQTVADELHKDELSKYELKYLDDKHSTTGKGQP